MALPDQMIEPILINNTRIPLEEIEAMNIKDNPRNAKIFTATEVVSIFFNREAGEAARQAFLDTFSNKAFPEDAPCIEIDSNKIAVFALLKLCKNESNSEFRRLLKQGAVNLNGEKITDENAELVIDGEAQLKIGKRGFFRIKVK